MVLQSGGQEYRLDYESGESQSDLFGGNSNWWGPIWMAGNFLIVLALEQYHDYCGEDLRVECPTGSGRMMNLQQVARDLGRPLAYIVFRDENARRAVFGSHELFNTDPNWRGLICSTSTFTATPGEGAAPATRRGGRG